MNAPVRFSEAVEEPIENEEQVHRDLIDTMRSITETTSEDYGHAVRSVHAKAHGIFAGTLEIEGSLPPELAQGLFAVPGRHQVVMRISTNPGDILDDAVSAPRGLALKILDVVGERLPESRDETTQNVVMVNAPAFAAPDAKAFLGSLKQLAATTDKAEWAKKLLSATLRGVESALEAVGGKSAMISTMGGAPLTHPLGDSYYSQTPFRYGEHIAKFALVPVSPNLTALTGDKVETSDRPDALREVIRETMIEDGGTWELRVQLNIDLDAMPIEDASVEWDEKAVLIVPWVASPSSRSFRSVPTSPARSTRRRSSALGMAWPRIVRSARSTGRGAKPTRCQPSSGASSTVARCMTWQAHWRPREPECEPFALRIVVCPSAERSGRPAKPDVTM